LFRDPLDFVPPSLDDVQSIREKLKLLKEEDKALDLLVNEMQQDLVNLSQDQAYDNFAYLTLEDVTCLELN
jgi:hypothetical protein